MAATAATTERIDRPLPIPAARRAVTAGVAVVIAALLLASAPMDAFHAFARLAARPEVEGLRQGTTSDARRLTMALDRLEQAGKQPEGDFEKALLAAALAGAVGQEPAKAAALLDQAETALRHGLSREPLSAHAWTRLAFLVLRRFETADQSMAMAEQEALRRQALAALRLATDLAVHDPRLALARLDLWMRLDSGLDADDRERANRQLLIAFTLNPLAVSQLAARNQLLMASSQRLADAGVSQELLANWFPITMTP